ncbi:MAG: threonine synthase [Candidatus Ancillula sp.]|nr:threonine synthase [Candidatus Ancillula sp.]
MINEYAGYIPEHIKKTVVTLGEGGIPLIRSSAIEHRLSNFGLQAEVYIKFEGRNPTGSFKDRGMTGAISAEKAKGTSAVICASTGNTSASAAAYATAAGMTSAVLVPDGKIATGKLAQAIAHGAKLLQVDGNFDDCLVIARGLAENYNVGLVNSVNPNRLQTQKTASFEIVDELGDAPWVHAVPVGNAANISAYWMGYKEYSDAGNAVNKPVMWGFQAKGSAPIVDGRRVENPETIATAIRIGNPASWNLATAAVEESGGLFDAVTDEEILVAHRILSSEAGVFVEPASAAPLAGLLKKAEHGKLKMAFDELAQIRTGIPKIVFTSTGHGLKDPDWALYDVNLKPKEGSQPIKVKNSIEAVANILEL